MFVATSATFSATNAPPITPSAVFTSFWCSGLYLYLPELPVWILLGSIALFFLSILLNFWQSRKTA